ncbi:MAG: metal-dependent phosphoesterase, partial [Candidatus Bathyarchaeota archaeon B23]
MRIDLHLHTVHSGDSSITLGEALRWCERRGLDGFAVTDHDTVEGVRGLPREGGCLIIP